MNGNKTIVVDYLARFDRASIAMQVRAKIIEQLPDGMPKQEHIADTLHVSLRSLQRRLKEEETSFKDLLEDTRQSLAEQYLREQHRSIGAGRRRGVVEESVKQVHVTLLNRVVGGAGHAFARVQRA